MTSLLVVLLAISPSFCEGFRFGYQAAFCSGHQLCSVQRAPLCPESSSAATWDDGYSAGFKLGAQDHRCDHKPCADWKEN